ncbi:MAG: hypothetical protein R2932_48835 [Caldilineaceae bacterium]
MQRGRATGALLDSEDDRWATQSLLDYWSATGYSVGREMPDAVLEEFDPNLAPEIPDDRCPYVGLAAFRAGQQPYFFGRKQLVDTLLEKVTTDRLIAVIGPSGSGKSSIILAGLLPALQDGAIPAQESIPASNQWRYSKRMVPGSDPLANLTSAILPEATENDLDVTLAAKFIFAADGCRRESDYLLKLFNETGNTPYVLVIDQFEELFTLCTDETARRALINNLLTLIKAPNPRHMVILTMRTDFESFVARLPDFQERFEAAIVRVTPLNAAELRAVIERPAALIGLKFEDGVVDALVQDVLGEPAALPLLQFTLLKLWEQRERNRITWASYKALGGGRLALARSADRLYENLIPEEQITARRILLRLVRPGDGLEITSNRVRRSVLYQTGEARDRVDRVLDRLIGADLLRLSPGDKPEDAQIEVAHEALVRNWPRLVGWLEDERERIRERLRLTEAAEQWLKVDRDPGALLRGALLEDAQRHPDLSELEQEYLQASLQARLAAEAEREAVYQRELEQARALAAEQKERAESESQWARYQAFTAAKLRQRAWLLGLTTVSALLLAGAAVWLGYLATSQADVARMQEATAIAARQDAEIQATAAGDARQEAEQQAIAADVARQDALVQAGTAVAARATAEADKVVAQTAVAEAQAEQTRVQHLVNAIQYTSGQLEQIQGTMVSAVASPPGTTAPPISLPATPTPPARTTPTPAAVVAPALTATVTATPARIAVEATGETPESGLEEDVVTPEIAAIVAGEALTVVEPAMVYALTDTVSLTQTAGITQSALITQGALITQTPSISTSLIAILPDINVPIYAEPDEQSTVLATLRAPLRLPVLQADSFWVELQLSAEQSGWVQTLC